MTINLQASVSSARAAPSRPSRFSVGRFAGLHAWWRRAGRVPLVLRRIAPPSPLAEAPMAGRPTLEETGALIARAALDRPGGLMNAYVASAVDVALEAEALSDGAVARRIRVPLHELVAQVGEALQPCATAAGVRLIYDRDSRWSCVATTDPARLRKAVHHLALRALSGPGDLGTVRIMVAARPGATRIAVAALTSRPDPGPFDLSSLTRMLQAIGAVLVVESDRAGCTPVSILLPTPPPAPLGIGDPDGEIVFGRRP